jgi:hypothetical protein
VRLSVDPVQNRLNLERVVALNVLEAVGPRVAGGGGAGVGQRTTAGDVGEGASEPVRRVGPGYASGATPMRTVTVAIRSAASKNGRPGQKNNEPMFIPFRQETSTPTLGHMEA